MTFPPNLWQSSWPPLLSIHSSVSPVVERMLQTPQIVDRTREWELTQVDAGLYRTLGTLACALHVCANVLILAIHARLEECAAFRKISRTNHRAQQTTSTRGNENFLLSSVDDLAVGVCETGGQGHPRALLASLAIAALGHEIGGRILLLATFFYKDSRVEEANV